MREGTLAALVKRTLDETADKVANVSEGLTVEELKRWEAKPVMLSLPAVVWASLESFEKDSTERISIEELVQEAVLKASGMGNPMMAAISLAAGIGLLRKSKKA